MFHSLVMLGTTLAISQLIMFSLWVIYMVRGKVKIVDIGWALTFAAAVCIDFMLGDGYLWRKILILMIVLIWSLRLAGYLISRSLNEKDDPRYAVVLQKWPFSRYPHFQVLTHFAFQGLLASFLSFPFILMMQNQQPHFSSFEMFGLLIWVVGIIGEVFSDYQLSQFKTDPNNSGHVCKRGLWKFSRHPNYFFEWIIWVGFGTMAFTAPFGYLSFIAPLLMLFLLIEISGIPLNENEALKTKGDDYLLYQSQTSAFVPWFRRKKDGKRGPDEDKS